MNIRGQAAIVGIAELPTQQQYQGRSSLSLLTEAAHLAIMDAGLRKEDIDGLITYQDGPAPLDLTEYMGLSLGYIEGMAVMGASGAHSIAVASMAVATGLANYVVCVFGGTLDPEAGATRGGGAPRASKTSEFQDPYGPVIAANGWYALLKQRHMYEFGTKDEQFAKMAVNQRFNALNSENAVFKGKPISLEDVLNSRMICDPLHMLECVMPCAGAGAVVITSAERAKSLRNSPVYVLGIGASASDHDLIWQSPRMTTSPAARTARKAYEMSGYGPKDVQLAEFYD
ncbi:MAG: thiolase family protein [Chloroflexi bacterium]|nr:thiolase family protein [Chloroflexota bacterium]